MYLLRMLIGLSLLAAPAVAAAPEWRQAREYDVQISSYDIQPSRLRLRAGQPVRLRLINASRQDHQLVAGDFLAASQVRSRDRAAVAGGRIAVAAGETVELALVPAPGRYRVTSSNFFHRLLGLRGDILVE